MLLLLVRVAHAAVPEVDPDDASAYATLADTVAAATSGDEIELSEATHTACVTIDGLAISITSAKPATLTGANGCEAMLTIVGRVERHDAGRRRPRGARRRRATVTVTGVAFQDLTSRSDGVVAYATNGATIEMHDSTVLTTTADRGAIFLGDGAAAALWDSTFDDSHAADGSVVYAADGTAASPVVVDMHGIVMGRATRPMSRWARMGSSRQRDATSNRGATAACSAPVRHAGARVSSRRWLPGARNEAPALPSASMDATG